MKQSKLSGHYDVHLKKNTARDHGKKVRFNLLKDQSKP